MMRPNPSAGEPDSESNSDAATTHDAMPRASIVICCHNQAHFLADAIQSAIQQSWQNLEVIIVDDGSTDDTALVAGGFPNVTYRNQPNGGLASARNLGLSASNGEFVCFLDADDRLASRAIEAGVMAARSNPACAFVAGRYRLTDAKFTALDVAPNPRPAVVGYADLLRFNSIAMCATVLFRREALLSVGGFDTLFAAAEDHDAYLRLARRYPIALHDELVADYRQHDANMTRDAGRMLTAIIAVLERQRADVVGDTVLEQALAAGLAGYRSSFGRAVLRQAAARLMRQGDVAAAWQAIKLTARLAPRAFGSVVYVAATRTWRRRADRIASGGARGTV